MARKQDNKLDIIRLKRDEEEKPAAPVRRSSQVRKLVIRLLPGINENLRRETRYRGDLSVMIVEGSRRTSLRVPAPTVFRRSQDHP